MHIGVPPVAASPAILTILSGEYCDHLPAGQVRWRYRRCRRPTTFLTNIFGFASAAGAEQFHVESWRYRVRKLYRFLIPS
ncbi:MAG: hypothetical protein HRF40_04645 [Nitrososphaera sp.]